MFQPYKNIQTDFLGQIFLEVFQFKARSLFWDPVYRMLLYRAVFSDIALLAQWEITDTIF